MLDCKQQEADSWLYGPMSHGVLVAEPLSVIHFIIIISHSLCKTVFSFLVSLFSINCKYLLTAGLSVLQSMCCSSVFSVLVTQWLQAARWGQWLQVARWGQ